MFLGHGKSIWSKKTYKYLWGVMLRMWHCVIGWAVPDILNECNASTFTVKQSQMNSFWPAEPEGEKLVITYLMTQHHNPEDLNSHTNTCVFNMLLPDYELMSLKILPKEDRSLCFTFLKYQLYTIFTAKGCLLEVESNQLQKAAIIWAVPSTLCDIAKVKRTLCCSTQCMTQWRATTSVHVSRNYLELFISIDHSQKLMDVNLSFKDCLN